MAKGITAAPKKKRRKQRLSEHAQLVEERARSIPPRVVHDLFDTSGLPVPPPPPARPARGRFVSKPPPPPPRPSHRPPPPPVRSAQTSHVGEDAELADLDELEDAEELDEVDELEDADAAEESHKDGFGSHTVPSAPSAQAASRPSWLRSRWLPAMLGVLLVGALVLATGRKFGRSSTAAPRVEVKAAPLGASAGVASPLAPVAVEPPPAAPVIEASSASSASEDLRAPAGPGPREATNAAVVAVSPDAVSVAASSRVHAPPSVTGAARNSPVTSEATGGFDVAAAEAAIEAAFRRARECRSASDPKGVATVTLTYAPSGRITTALVSGTFAGTSIGSCVAAALRSARIPPFSGSLVTVKRSANL
jgi:hypothetical protein